MGNSCATTGSQYLVSIMIKLFCDTLYIIRQQQHLCDRENYTCKIAKKRKNVLSCCIVILKCAYFIIVTVLILDFTSYGVSAINQSSESLFILFYFFLL